MPDKNNCTFPLTPFANTAYTLPVKRKTLQTKDVVEMLRKRQGDRSLRRYAADLGISPSYLSEIYRGTRRPGEVVLQNLGLSKSTKTEITYVAS